MKKPRLRLITSLFLLTLTPRIPAEIITDGTVGPQSTLSGPNYMIGHDLGQCQQGLSPPPNQTCQVSKTWQVVEIPYQEKLT
jgi:hypothetical protein